MGSFAGENGAGGEVGRVRCATLLEVEGGSSLLVAEGQIRIPVRATLSMPRPLFDAHSLALDPRTTMKIILFFSR